jgi:hypothetical protein
VQCHGFKGIVTSVTEFLNGCRRIGVQPPVDKDGKIPDALSIDEPQLTVMKAKKVKKGPKTAGGLTTRIPARRVTR